MKYKAKRPMRSMIKRSPQVEGETIEHKVERLVQNKEPIKDGAPEIFTERKEGVIAGYNIRTDRWELAAEAMDIVNKSREAKRDDIIKHPASKKAEDGKAESTQGESDGKESVK